MSVARKKKRDGKSRVSQSQLQAYRARQDAVLSREEVDRRREEERRRLRAREEQAVERAEEAWLGASNRRQPEDDVPTLSAEYIASEYESVRKELYQIAIWGGLMFVLLAAIAVYMR
jgi:hypothetical protein